jgi:hypothetical protein
MKNVLRVIPRHASQRHLVSESGEQVATFSPFYLLECASLIPLQGHGHEREAVITIVNGCETICRY